MLEAIFSPKVRKKSRKAAAKPSTTVDAPMSRREGAPSRRAGDSPESSRLGRRSVEPEVAHPRISLAEPPDPSPVRPRVRPVSEAPPPLRPSIPPPPLAIAPLRTPISTSTEPHSRLPSDPDANEDPSDDGSRQSEP